MSTSNDELRQKILMYVRDKIIDPIMPPVVKTHKVLGKSKTRDHVLIDGLSEKHSRELLDIIEAHTKQRVQAAEDKVIKKAHKPCECGKEHFGTPVRSVQGNVTTYCQFSRVKPSRDGK